MSKIEWTQEGVRKYQCPGCMRGEDIDCGEYEPSEFGCGRHAPGTVMSVGATLIGTILPAMPIGFCRLGSALDKRRLEVLDGPITYYNKFNVPVWKHLDENGNTIVRGLTPRVNRPFLHVWKGDRRTEIDCLEITTSDIAEMD